MRLYVASSWRNTVYPDVLKALVAAGHECYDFRNPKPGDNGFHWSSINPDWYAGDGQRRMTLKQYRDEALTSSQAKDGFGSDFSAMQWAEGCVLVLPCGRSAHLEAGWFAGQKKPLVIVLHETSFEPELMYLMADAICLDVAEAVDALKKIAYDVAHARDDDPPDLYGSWQPPEKV